MVHILFISRTWPYPSRNGVELPIAELASRLSVRHQVDMAVWQESDNDRMRRAEENISGRTFYIPSKVQTLSGQILRESFGIDASFMTRSFDIGKLEDLARNKTYDWAWVSPIGGLGLLRACKKTGLTLTKNIVVGQNDVISWCAWNGFLHVLRGGSRFSTKRVLRGLRTPALALYERRYCCMTDLVCVQTELESTRMKVLLGRQVKKTRVVVLPNGCKEFLKAVDYDPNSAFNILYMTHLEGPRAYEAHWFLKRVWPVVTAMEPEARLHLVGTLSHQSRALVADMGPNVEIRGFVPDLRALYGSMTLSVVPTPHACGLVNRVQDALVAGLPVVARSGPLSTIDGLVPGRDAITADTPSEFACQIVDLLHKPARRRALGLAGRELASRLPSWQDTAERAEALLCGRYKC